MVSAGHQPGYACWIVLHWSCGTSIIRGKHGWSGQLAVVLALVCGCTEQTCSAGQLSLLDVAAVRPSSCSHWQPPCVGMTSLLHLETSDDSGHCHCWSVHGCDTETACSHPLCVVNSVSTNYKDTCKTVSVLATFDMQACGLLLLLLLISLLECHMVCNLHGPDSLRIKCMSQWIRHATSLPTKPDRMLCTVS